MSKKLSKLRKPKGFFLFSNSVFSDIKLLRENISLIIIIPTVLGGLLQLYNLSNISPEYIRFFSLSQVVPDGLLFLVIAISFILSFEIITYFSYKFLKGIKQNKVDNEEELVNPPSKWTSLFPIIYFILILTAYYRVGLLNLSFQYRFGGISFFFDVFWKISMLNILIIIGVICLTSVYNILFKNYLEENKSFFKPSELKKLLHFFYKIMSIGYFILIVSMINNAYGFKLKNIDYLTSDIISKNKLYVEPKLLYYNDKYLFYEFRIQDNPEVIIYEFDKLFNIEYTIIEDKESYERTRLQKINDSISNIKIIKIEKQIDSIRELTKKNSDSMRNYLGENSSN